MSLTIRRCSECGEKIKFSYVVPERSYIIENGDFKRDDIHTGMAYDDPFLDFYCASDLEHNIYTDGIEYEKKFDEWCEEIRNDFYKQNMHAT